MTTFYAMSHTHRRSQVLAFDYHRDNLEFIGTYARAAYDPTTRRTYEVVPVYAGDYCTIGA